MSNFQEKSVNPFRPGHFFSEDRLRPEYFKRKTQFPAGIL